MKAIFYFGMVIVATITASAVPYTDNMNRQINFTLGKPTIEKKYLLNKSILRPELTSYIDNTNCCRRSEGKKDKKKIIEKMRRELIKCTNKYRIKHHAKPLKESTKLNRKAQKWAQHLANRRLFSHQRSGHLGENLYSYTSTDRRLPKAKSACNAWYNEVKDYNYRRGSMGTSGHFTQLVWKKSKETGVGIANRKGRYVIVAKYYPAGNVIGRFQSNVLPP